MMMMMMVRMTTMVRMLDDDEDGVRTMMMAMMMIVMMGMMTIMMLMMLMKPIASSCYGGDSDGRDDRDQRPHDGDGCTERHIVHGGTATSNRHLVVIPCFEDDKRCRRAVRRPKNGHRDPLHKVEHERSTEIERCLASLVALNEPGAGIVHLVHRLLWF